MILIVPPIGLATVEYFCLGNLLIIKRSLILLNSSKNTSISIFAIDAPLQNEYLPWPKEIYSPCLRKGSKTSAFGVELLFRLSAYTGIK